MNLMLFEPGEITSETLVVRGERARELIRHRKIKYGDRVRVGEVDGLWGWGTVVAVHDGEVQLDVALSSIDDPNPVTVVLGLPRPQILKKVLQCCSMMGVTSIVCVRSSRSEKSFLHSPLLQPEVVRSHLKLGLEQGIGTRIPSVSIFPDFRSFTTEWLDGCSDHSRWRFLAEPKSAQTLETLVSSQPIASSAQGAVAIGPEGGWQENEIEAFNARGFRQFQLGNRILRVDVAVPVILGQLALLMKWVRREE